MVECFPMKREKKFQVSTLGCRTNQYESQGYEKQLRELGYTEAKEGEEADLCIVNTCSVTEGADRSSRHQIRQLSRLNPNAKMVVTGCFADRKTKDLLEMDEVDEIVPNTNKEELLAIVFPKENIPEFAIDQFSGHTRAFVKVQDGCNSFCTYCIIPYVRGRSRSREIGAILKEVQVLVENGYKEVVITGVNVGDFNGGGRSLAQLVREIDQVDGLMRLRISSIDPDEVDDDLLDAVITGNATCHSMHIVLQSGSNAILKKMNRKYTRQKFVEAIEKCKSASKDFTFTTDIIVGFPGETEADFSDTLDLMRQVQFAKVHMFPYSPRERTRAALYPNQIPQEMINARRQKVLRLSEQIAYDLREKYVGRTMPVLLEDIDEGMFFGHTENFLEVFIPAADLQSNEIVDVTLKKNSPKGFVGCVSK
ncbi:MAG: Threonylcarbamoyladenosine tRNA methylthiotransferase MtaB [Chlamydiae bacterium]|nr:Threonylcarbamoyladenosine tRNA methylthiotransferase MtaB [Chlamydiota bacterium]